MSIDWFSIEVLAQRLLEWVTPGSPVERARHALACEHLEDLRRFDEQMRASKQRLATVDEEIDVGG